MSFLPATDSATWDNTSISAPHAEFLQSWAWGEFQRTAGLEPLRLKAASGEQWQGFVHHLPFGMKYLYCPRVSILRDEILREFFDEIKKQNFSFARIEPVRPISMNNEQLTITKNRQPRHTLILDLKKDDGALLGAMHQKTRYNIHLARRGGVEIREEKNARVFWRLNQETTARDQFKSHDEAYYEKMLAQPNARQLTAYHQGQPIATNIFIYFGDTFTYLHGASASRERGLMAPYLLQWEGMKLGKQLGAHRYDFWGVAPFVASQEAKEAACFHNKCWPAKHPWSGITRFKVGFGGEVREYPQAIDIIFDRQKYFLYTMSRRLRSIIPF